MKKITLKLTFDQACGLDRYMQERLSVFLHDGNGNKCIGALLAMWQLTKLKPKTYIRQLKPLRFKIEAPVAYAFAYFIEISDPQPDDLGNQLIKFYGEIDHEFNNKQ